MVFANINFYITDSVSKQANNVDPDQTIPVG